MQTDQGVLRADHMKKIMIVDDEYLIRYSLSTVFRDPGTEVTAVADGKTAIEAVQQSQIDLCFLDIQLPDMNGLEIMKKFRSISPWTRIVIITGSVLTNAMMQSIHDNAHCLISKPFDLEQVKSIANRMLTKDGPLYPGKGAEISSEDSSVQWLADDYR
jgi:CheY-like chemotaxis protein